jgi:hypothetical protein
VDLRQHVLRAADFRLVADCDRTKVGSGEGEPGCISDANRRRVEPTERPAMRPKPVLREAMSELHAGERRYRKYRPVRSETMDGGASRAEREGEAG